MAIQLIHGWTVHSKGGPFIIVIVCPGRTVFDKTDGLGGPSISSLAVRGDSLGGEGNNGQPYYKLRNVG